ncbi:hypothetical protein BV394_08865 [Brevirhabdus pacifica]|uniref:Aminoglycoside phosphotransferase domain-containing protein n=2 Tax=Brevirhabdus pacifica TaxID=1267768 RepID=A0A1U7DIL1_9RHOB|nr:hypothetical protein BV394_08865 [Brevirhabdus pacifica]
MQTPTRTGRAPAQDTATNGDRAAATRAFLKAAGWAEAQRRPLAGDASNRRYERLHHPRHGAAVLMDAPPERGEDVRPFLRIGAHLADLGLSAPRVFAGDEALGLLLLEDLGDDLYARVLTRDPALERPLYEAATDVLISLAQSRPPAPIEDYDARHMAEAASLVISWYRRALTGQEDPDLEQTFQDEVERACLEHCQGPRSIALRDFHAENLLWLPERQGEARVGLLDFQDATTAHPAYDLVSLLEDARRDVPEALSDAMTDRFLKATGFDRADFLRARDTLSAQRNLRILGVFARLGLRDGKPHYLAFVPRVWNLLQRDLRHPALADLRASVERHLPEPTPDILKGLANRCQPAVQTAS